MNDTQNATREKNLDLNLDSVSIASQHGRGDLRARGVQGSAGMVPFRTR